MFFYYEGVDEPRGEMKGQGRKRKAKTVILGCKSELLLAGTVVCLSHCVVDMI